MSNVGVNVKWVVIRFVIYSVRAFIKNINLMDHLDELGCRCTSYPVPSFDITNSDYGVLCSFFDYSLYPNLTLVLLIVLHL